MNNKGSKYDDETRSQYSVDRRSVGTAHTARSARELEVVVDNLDPEDVNVENAEIFNEVGVEFFLEKNHSKALDHLTTALNMYRNLQANSSVKATHAIKIADILEILGTVYLARKVEELNKALPNYQKANAENVKARNHFNQALTKKREHYGQAVINITIAKLERYLGLTYLSETNTIADAEAAITYLSNALRDFKIVHGEDTVHIDIADTYCHLGCAYQQKNDCERAREEFTAALVMFQEIFSVPNHVKIAETFYKIGFTYLAVGNHSKAISSFTKSHDIYMRIRETNPSIDPNYAELCFHFGKTYFEMSDFDSAKPHIENAWLMYQGLYRSSNPNHPLIKVSETLLREVEQKRLEQSAKDPVQDRSPATVQNPKGKVVQTSTLPVASGQATDLGHTKTAAISRSGQEERPLQISTSNLSIFATSSAAASAPPTQAPPTVQEVKLRYMKIAGMWNAHKKIFKTESLDEIVIELRKRAGNGGASAKTLTAFGFSLT